MKIADMIGGTNSCGICSDVFELPAGYLMRYDVPAEHLRPFVSGYAVYGCHHRVSRSDAFLPAPAMICILADAGPVSVRMRHYQCRSVPDVALYGPSSEAMQSTTNGGINIGVGLTPLGWASLVPCSAMLFRNRVAALQDVVDGGLTARLRAAVVSVRCDDELALALDDALTDSFYPDVPYSAMIKCVSSLLCEEGITSVHQLIDRCNIANETLRRLCKSTYGLCPKHLLSRARFLRTYSKWKSKGAPLGDWCHDSDYYDVSHYLRDANTFLGTTPRRFNARGNLFLDASLRARAAILGASSHALHVPA